jgi:hypothetical protein
MAAAFAHDCEWPDHVARRPTLGGLFYLACIKRTSWSMKGRILSRAKSQYVPLRTTHPNFMHRAPAQPFRVGLSAFQHQTS